MSLAHLPIHPCVPPSVRPARALRPRPPHALAALLLCTAVAQAAPAAEGLPGEALLRQALLAAPSTGLADAQWRAEQAGAALVRQGPYDWVLRAGLQRRDERAGARFAEREVAIERTWRWGNKAALDGQMADQALALAGHTRQLAWQDAAGSLLGLWFDAQREQRAAWHQQAQLGLAEAQVAAVRRRVAAGDAPLLALRQAEGEAERTAAAQASAAQRAQASALRLTGRYPLLAEAWSAASQEDPPGPRPALALPPSGAPLATPGPQEARSPALAAAQAQVALARLAQQRAQADRSADPTLGLRLAQERGGAERVLGLTVSIPFGTAARDQRVQLAAAAQAVAQAQLAELQTRLQTEARQLADAPERARLVHTRLQAAAQAAETSVRLTERAHAAGEAPLAELLQQRRLASDAALALALSRIDVLEAQARLALSTQHLLAAPARAD